MSSWGMDNHIKMMKSMDIDELVKTRFLHVTQKFGLNVILTTHMLCYKWLA